MYMTGSRACNSSLLVIPFRCLEPSDAPVCSSSSGLPSRRHLLRTAAMDYTQAGLRLPMQQLLARGEYRCYEARLRGGSCLGPGGHSGSAHAPDPTATLIPWKAYPEFLRSVASQEQKVYDEFV
eukprot:GHVU01154279.1.p1 GENE.GHVU01154279.1~~GHVU01154279.1.p1  ORF type:complete len:124 (+),score=11.19 GHVU01154279.1:554-925(+)